MAITTYAELQTAIAAWLRRTDLTATIPSFITLAEAQLNRQLRVRPMILTATTSINTEYGTVPGDFLEPISFALTTSQTKSLDCISQARMALLATLNTGTREPESYAVVGTQFRYWPVPDQAYTALLTYYQKIPALADTNTSNWLLASHPDVYLFGALMQAAEYLKDQGRAAQFASLYSTVMEDVKSGDHTSNQTTLRTDAALSQRGQWGRFNIMTGL